MEEKFLYHHEAQQTTETVKEKALRLELLRERYGGLMLCNTSPMEKPFNHSPLKSAHIASSFIITKLIGTIIIAAVCFKLIKVSVLLLLLAILRR